MGINERRYCDDYNIFKVFCYFLNQQQSSRQYTINVLVIIVVPFQSDQPFADHFIFSPFFYLSLAQNSNEYNKLYIGQLPLSITQPFIRDALCKFTEVRDVRIIKGDARGNFDRFCYAFVMVKGSQDLCNQAIKKINELQPDWKINVKVDNDRFKFMQQTQNPNQPRRTQQHMNPYEQGQQPQQRMNYQQKQQNPSYYPQQGYTSTNPTLQQQLPYQPPSQQFNQPPQQFYAQKSHQFQQSNMGEPQTVVGENPYRILVREVWLGGIPELCDKNYMHQLMSEFGIVENLEIFPKFAFIKFKMVQQATLAFERAQRIYMMFGNPQGFKIKFSDHSRRANIVGNHYEYDRQSPFLPVLYLGFPPVTSAVIDLELMKSICEKFGPIVNSYMRKSNNNNTRSQFLFTFDNLKSALRAKGQLNRRRDLLGDKRVEVTLLLDEQIVLKNRDLSHTEKLFGLDSVDKRKPFTPSSQKQFNDKPQFDKPQYDNAQYNKPQYDKPQYDKPQYDKPSYQKQFEPRQYQNYPPGKQIPQIPNLGTIPPYPGMYQQPPPTMHYPPYMVPQQGQIPRTYPQQDMYYMQNMYPPFNTGKETERSSSTDVHELLQSVLEKSQNPNIEKKPIKTSSNNDQNASDIVSKMLGQDREPQDHGYFKEREVTWSGFLTWKGLHRVEVDGYAESKQLEDYVISINHTIDLKDMILKEKTTMILACGSPIHEPLFKEYLRALKGKAGVSSTPHSLMYILTKSKESDEIQEIRDNELLVVMQRASLFSLIKDKLQKCEQLK